MGQPSIEPEVLAEILRVPGSTDAEEVALLYGLAARNRSGVIVEVGSARGRSTVALALGSKSGYQSPVYALDPHERFVGVMGGRFTPEFRGLFFKNLLKTGTAEIVRLVNLSSEIVTPGWTLEVGLLFVDGDHTYEAVKRDYLCWLPHLLPGGLMVFHDSLDTAVGVHLVLREAIAAGELRELEVVSRATVLQKARAAEQ